MSIVAKMQSEHYNVLITIRSAGYESALRSAFSRYTGMAPVAGAEEAIRLLKVSRSCLSDANRYRVSPELYEKYTTVARFYRHLAHKLYWFSLENGSQHRREFLQEVK